MAKLKSRKDTSQFEPFRSFVIRAFLKRISKLIFSKFLAFKKTMKNVTYLKQDQKKLF